METKTNDIKIVKNEASLYVNGRMQYQAVNLVTEYGAKLHGCKYAIASKHPQWKMEKRFEESLDQFRPYIFLTGKEYAAILESQQNDDKFHKSKEGVSKMLKPKFKFTLVPQFPANLL